MRLILLSLLLIECYSSATAQRDFADHMMIGTSLTYLRFNEKDIYKNNYGYDEFTWNTNIGVSISKHIFAGLQILNIFSSQISKPKNHYIIYGLFSQFNIINFKGHRLFAEASFNQGNYCLCGDIPYKADDLYYLGIGVGYDFPFKKIPNLYLDFSFMTYPMLNKIEGKDVYNQYVVGLNYRFNLR